MNWNKIVEELQSGKVVQCRPKGNSMQGKIESGQLVTISPDTNVEKGDIVFCKVNGHFYIHLISAVRGEQYQISNNKNHVNGWTTKIFGKVTKVE